MKGKISLYGVFIITSMIVITSCATSALKSGWHDSTYKGGPLRKVLVMGVDRNPAVREKLEDSFSTRLTAEGAAAISSYTLFPEDEIPDRELVLKKINELGIDSVLVTRIVDVRNAGMYETYPTQVVSGYYDYYVLCCQSIVSQGYVVMVETKIFNAKYNKLIWSGLSESAFKNSLEPVIHSFISVVVRDLHDKKLLQ